MKKRLFTLLVTASFLSVVKPAFAATTDNTDQELQKVAAQTAALESQMAALKKEIHQLKAEQGHLKKTTRRIVQRREENFAPVKTPVSPVEETKNGPVIKHAAVTYLAGTPVVIAPYIGPHSAFN